jgi:FixJ family two-component response regulator
MAPFSDRRRRILDGILGGQPVGKIATDVGCSERTVFSTRQAAAKILERVLTAE